MRSPRNPLERGRGEARAIRDRSRSWFGPSFRAGDPARHRLIRYFSPILPGDPRVKSCNPAHPAVRAWQNQVETRHLFGRHAAQRVNAQWYNQAACANVTFRIDTGNQTDSQSRKRCAAHGRFVMKGHFR